MAGKKKSKSKAKSMTQHDRAGTTFPVGRLGRMLRDVQNGCGIRVSSKAPVFLAAALEFLALEVLEASGDECDKGKFKRIKPVHIQQAVNNDTELVALLHNTTLSNAGKKHHIEEALLHKKKN